MLAGIVATTITNPIDIIRTRLQFHKYQDKEKYRSIQDGFNKIYHNEGIKGFFRGLAPRLIKKPLSNTISWIMYESLSNVYGNKV